MSALQAETCLHLATIGGTTHRQHVHAAGQGRAKYLLPRTHIREIYIFFEHPAPSTSPPVSPPLLRVNTNDLCRAECAAVRVCQTVATPARGTVTCPLPSLPSSSCCPCSLVKPLAAQPTRYLSFNATHHQQQQQRLQPRQHHILFTASGSCT